MSRYERVEEPARHLTPQQRAAIRAAYSDNPELTYAQLALRFRVTSRQVRHAVRDLRRLNGAPTHPGTF